MRRLNRLTVVGLCIFSFCCGMSAEADEFSTFGFQSQAVEDDDPIGKAQSKMQREALSQKVIDKLYQKNVLNKQKYERVERDRLTLFVVEKMLRDPSTSPEEREKLEAQWRELKMNEGKHLKDYRRYTMEQNKILEEKARERNKQVEEKVKKLRQEAAKKAQKEKYGYLAEPITPQEDFMSVKTGRLASVYQDQINTLTAKIASDNQLSNPAGSYYAEEEEEETDSSFDRIFSDEDYRKSQLKRQQPSSQAPIYADSVAQAQRMFANQNGLLLPNSPLGLSPQKREEIRQKVEIFMKQHNIAKIRADERETLNAILFNYGIQVLETGDVIALEVIEDYTNGERMVAPDVPVPSSAQQVYVGPENLIHEMTGN